MILKKNSRYYGIIKGDKKAKYLQCKHIPVNFNKSDNTKKLWKKHNESIRNKEIINNKPEKSLLDLKIEIASRIIKECSFCERKCGVDRTINFGECKVTTPLIASEFLHYGEESLLIPSYTIFFSGCNFHCVFCQNWDISQNTIGKYIKPIKLQQIINERKTKGARNVNWVGGDPTPNIYYILKTLNHADINIPQIWNSNMYGSLETLKLLNGIIDVYLTDFKYGNDKCALRLSKIKKYLKIIKRNHLIIVINGEVIIRHLVLPNHIECCTKPILEWISDNINYVSVNIMFQYTPKYEADKYEDISVNVSKMDFLKINNILSKLNISLI